ncbi:uncharacterized protein IWZ02DRAFT_491789 [Phyllosticta citriasiana]|uniref:uncharacterized protein n=1 Tax=Phyllosticta citriasiana TaxID=595635 RepID=UPI0030FD280C
MTTLSTFGTNETITFRELPPAAAGHDGDPRESESEVPDAILNGPYSASNDEASVHPGNGIFTTYYRYEWLWIALHCVVAVIGGAFLALIILRSREVGAPAWKSSSLAILSRGTCVAGI